MHLYDLILLAVSLAHVAAGPPLSASVAIAPNSMHSVDPAFVSYVLDPVSVTVTFKATQSRSSGKFCGKICAHASNRGRLLCLLVALFRDSSQILIQPSLTSPPFIHHIFCCTILSH